MLPPRGIATQQISSSSFELAPAAALCALRHTGFRGGAALETRVLISDAALAKTVRGDERWTYLWLSS